MLALSIFCQLVMGGPEFTEADMDRCFAAKYRSLVNYAIAAYDSMLAVTDQEEGIDEEGL